MKKEPCLVLQGEGENRLICVFVTLGYKQIICLTKYKAKLTSESDFVCDNGDLKNEGNCDKYSYFIAYETLPIYI